MRASTTRRRKRTAASPTLNNGRLGDDTQRERHKTPRNPFAWKDRDPDRQGDVLRRLRRAHPADIALFLAAAIWMLAALMHRRLALSPSSATHGTPAPALLGDGMRQVHGLIRFQATPLFRRGDYDDTFSHEFYPDDDGAGAQVQLKGMLPACHHRHLEERLHDSGYALVDDVAFYADDRRGTTRMALAEAGDVRVVMCRTGSPTSFA